MADALHKDKPVVVIGAGTMGSGIAEVAAAAGHMVYLRDANDTAIERGLGMIRASLDKRVARGKLDGGQRDAVLARVRPTMPDGALASVGLVIEVIYEDLEAKVKALSALERQLAPDAIVAAMRKGVNYPVGPMAWGRRIGHATVLRTLRNLGASYGEDRYRSSVWLQREVQAASAPAR